MQALFGAFVLLGLLSVAGTGTFAAIIVFALLYALWRTC